MLGPANIVQNKSNKQFYTISTLKTHVPNYRHPDGNFVYKLNITIQTLVYKGIIKTGRSKLMFINYAGPSITLEDFHYAVGVIVHEAEMVDVENIIDKFNVNYRGTDSYGMHYPYAFMTKGGLFNRKVPLIFTCSLEFADLNTSTPESNILLPIS